jgi:hypothetical protein
MSTALSPSEAQALLTVTRPPKSTGPLAAARDKLKLIVELDRIEDKCIYCNRTAREFDGYGLGECGRCPWSAFSIVHGPHGGNRQFEPRGEARP